LIEQTFSAYFKDLMTYKLGVPIVFSIGENLWKAKLTIKKVETSFSFWLLITRSEKNE
jgi:hypothetical protein